MACSAFALRVTTWGVNIGRFLTAFLTANLSTIYGWRTVPKIYAAIVAIFAVPFHLLSADSPNAWAKRASPAMSESEQKLLGVDLSAPEEAAEEKAKPARKLSDYRFLVSIAGLCPTVIHTADNMTSYWCGTSPSPRASLRASLRLTAPRCAAAWRTGLRPTSWKTSLSQPPPPAPTSAPRTSSPWPAASSHPWPRSR